MHTLTASGWLQLRYGTCQLDVSGEQLSADFEVPRILRKSLCLQERYTNMENIYNADQIGMHNWKSLPKSHQCVDQKSQLPGSK